MDISEARKSTGLTQAAFAVKLGLGPDGGRTVRGWESGEHKPSPDILELAKLIATRQPFRIEPNESSFRFIDLFAGIGGIRLPFQELGGTCVFTSEWDKFAQRTYAANFGDVPSGDITAINAADIPPHDVLLAGFPCQAFSQAGLKRGFRDTRGTMFFEIQRILAERKPKAFLLENVKQLKGHDKGRTLETILGILRGQTNSEVPADIPMSESARKSLAEPLNYWVDFRILKASDFGVPQNRERVYIVGFRRDAFGDVDFDKLFKWPVPSGQKTRVGDILEADGPATRACTISDKLWKGHQRRKSEHKEKGNGFGYSVFTEESIATNTISARYYKDGSEILIDQSRLGLNPRKLTPRECARLQGFPETFNVNTVSAAQAYRQFGNSVAVPAVRAVARAMHAAMTAAKHATGRAEAA
jgi:DNA (cytosine-5)-methyltransferase 1